MEKLLIVTDLDSSLLWHDYTYDEAKPTIKRIRELGFPLVLNSSKTLAEMQVLAAELQSTSPLIAENGGMVAYHNDEPTLIPPNINKVKTDSYTIINTGIARDTILQVAHDLRERFNYDFKGFYDFSEQELSDITKLDLISANKAKQRYATEPILWNDTEEKFAQFSTQLNKHAIQVIRGGKFIHLMGNIDKKNGVLLVIESLRTTYPNDHWKIVAIGDSENDLGMLEIADYPIVIPHDGKIRIKPQNLNTIYGTKNAAAGWAETVGHILDNFTGKKTTTTQT